MSDKTTTPPGTLPLDLRATIKVHYHHDDDEVAESLIKAAILDLARSLIQAKVRNVLVSSTGSYAVSHDIR